MKRRLLAVGLMAVLVLAAGCSSEKKETKEEELYFQGELSEEEMNQSHLSLNLTEKTSVDADITPYSKYRDGLNSYLTEKAGNHETIDIKAFEKSPEIFGKSFADIENKVMEIGKGTFEDEKRKVRYKKGSSNITLSVPYAGADGKKYVLEFTQETDKKLRQKGVTLSLTEKKNEEEYDNHDFSIEMLSDISLGQNIRSWLNMGYLNSEETELDFLSREEAAGQMRTFISEVTGMELAAECDCVMVSKNNYDTLAELNFPDKEAPSLEKEFYVGFFYPVLDGLEWKSAYFSTSYAANDEEEKDFYKREKLLLQPDEMAVCIGEQGLGEFELSNMVKVTDIYEEKKEICPIDEILRGIQEYFSGNSADGTLIPIKVINISLVYAGDVTEDYKSITKPYWCVQYNKEIWSGGEKGEIYFDAGTGDLISDY